MVPETEAWREIGRGIETEIWKGIETANEIERENVRELTLAGTEKEISKETETETDLGRGTETETEIGAGREIEIEKSKLIPTGLYL